MDEFTLRAASSTSNKKFNVFKLHKDDNIVWSDTKMRRENDYQPWQMKCGAGKTSRRFKATKEGGVGDNASYFIFYKSKDSNDTYEVCPVDEWYSVSATQRYKTLTAEEAEQQFEQRHKMLNLFSVMHLKKNGENSEEGGYGPDTKSFKVSELDEWGRDSGDDDDDGSLDGNESDDAKKAKRKKAFKKEKDEPKNAPDEAKEESDEGDFEQRELDYMSDTSSESSGSEQGKDETDVKGIAEEEALRDLLSTDDEEDGEGAQSKGIKSNDLKSSLNIDGSSQPGGDDNRSDDSSDSDDYDVDEEKMDSMFMNKGLPVQLTMVKQEIKQEPQLTESTTASTPTPANRSQTSTSTKRKVPPESTSSGSSSSSPPQPFKKPCLPETSSFPQNSQEKMIEDLIKKYLGRRPMTLRSLLKDIRTKLKRMGGASPDKDSDLVNMIANIIKKLNPERQKINDDTYYSLRS